MHSRKYMDRPGGRQEARSAGAPTAQVLGAQTRKVSYRLSSMLLTLGGMQLQRSGVSPSFAPRAAADGGATRSREPRRRFSAGPRPL